MKPRDYCCCAIPMVNAGIYATLTEQFVLAFIVAIVSLTSPSIVGASVPGFAALILAIICFVACAIQALGFMGVIRESPIIFRRYTTLHIMISLAAFSVALAWIIMSATGHNSAVTKCENTFFANSTASTSISTSTSFNEGQTLCNIFTWVDVGIMGGLWVILAIMQLYLYTVVSAYGTGQRLDHVAYESNIPLKQKHRDPWDARASPDPYGDASRTPLAQASHVRTESDASVATILAEQPQKSRDYYSDAPPDSYLPRRGTTLTRHGSRDESDSHHYLDAAYTQDPQPTLREYRYNNDEYENEDLPFPGSTKTHPGA